MERITTAEECQMDWVTFEDGGKISIHRRCCSNLGKNDRARYAQAVKKGGEWPYLFHASESAAERYARSRNTTPRGSIDPALCAVEVRSGAVRCASGEETACWEWTRSRKSSQRPALSSISDGIVHPPLSGVVLRRKAAFRRFLPRSRTVSILMCPSTWRPLHHQASPGANKDGLALCSVVEPPIDVVLVTPP